MNRMNRTQYRHLEDFYWRFWNLMDRPETCERASEIGRQFYHEWWNEVDFSHPSQAKSVFEYHKGRLASLFREYNLSRRNIAA